jgi:hypothetical protein
MNTKRYYEIEEDPKLNEDQKWLLHRIQDHILKIDFWNDKKKYADYYIEKNNEKIRKLNEKLRKSFVN